MSEINITLRIASAEDIDTMLAIEHACFSDPWQRDIYELLMRHRCVRFIIATEDNVPVGYAVTKTIIDECEILNIAVMPDHRKKGIGRIIMKHITDRGKDDGVTMFFLEHRVSNTAAAALYESFGFVEYDRRKNYYNHPKEDAILRKLTL